MRIFILVKSGLVFALRWDSPDSLCVAEKLLCFAKEVIDKWGDVAG